MEREDINMKQEYGLPGIVGYIRYLPLGEQRMRGCSDCNHRMFMSAIASMFCDLPPEECTHGRD